MAEAQPGRGEARARREGPGFAAFTICSKNYLHYASVLGASLAAAYPGARLTVVLADELEGSSARDLGDRLGLTLIEGSRLDLPTYYDMALRYSVLEFNTAVKAAAFRHLLERGGPSRVVYLDPDIQICAPLRPVEAAFEAGAELLLTPHVTRPLPEDGRQPSMTRLQQSGIYNLGFLGLADSPQVRALLDWWGDRLREDCRVAPEEGIFVDQRYMDFGPAFVERTAILSDQGLNVAYWNLGQRPLAPAPAGGWTAAGAPLHFLHFSGIRQDDPDIVSIHQDRLTMADLGAGRVLFDAYRAALTEAERRVRAALPDRSYAYDRFTDASPVLPMHRAAWRSAGPGRTGTRAEIFDARHPAFTAPAELGGEEGVNRLMLEIWRAQPRLRKAFDLRQPRGARTYAAWFRAVGAREMGLAAPAAAPAGRELPLAARTGLHLLSRAQGVRRYAGLFPKPVRQAALRLNRFWLTRLTNSR